MKDATILDHIEARFIAQSAVGDLLWCVSEYESPVLRERICACKDAMTQKLLTGKVLPV